MFKPKALLCSSTVQSNGLYSRPLSAVTAALIGLMLVSGVDAALIAYEGFDYAADSNLNTQSGGAGWTTAWTANGTTTSVAGAGLSYTDSNGNQLLVSGNSAISSGQTASAAVIRDLPQLGAGGTTTWLSFIGQRLSPHPTAEENLIRPAGVQLHDVGASPVERLSVGKGTTPTPSQTNWSILHSGNVANADYSTVSHLSQSFLVVRIDHIGDASTADNTWLWVNPDLDTQPLTTAADAELLGQLDFSYDRIRVFVGNANAAGPYAQFAYDELRLGTEFGDVAPILVPEPTSVALVLIAMIAGASGRKRN